MLKTALRFVAKDALAACFQRPQRSLKVK